MTDFENKIESLVNLIKDDYRQNRVIDKLDIFQQPSKGEIIKILNKCPLTKNMKKSLSGLFHLV